MTQNQAVGIPLDLHLEARVFQLLPSPFPSEAQNPRHALGCGLADLHVRVLRWIQEFPCARRLLCHVAGILGRVLHGSAIDRVEAGLPQSLTGVINRKTLNVRHLDRVREHQGNLRAGLDLCAFLRVGADGLAGGDVLVELLGFLRDLQPGFLQGLLRAVALLALHARHGDGALALAHAYLDGGAGVHLGSGGGLNLRDVAFCDFVGVNVVALLHLESAVGELIRVVLQARVGARVRHRRLAEGKQHRHLGAPHGLLPLGGIGAHDGVLLRLVVVALVQGGAEAGFFDGGLRGGLIHADDSRDLAVAARGEPPSAQGHANDQCDEEDDPEDRRHRGLVAELRHLPCWPRAVRRRVM